MLNYSQEILLIFIPAIAVVGGILIAIIAIIKDYQLRCLMVEKGIYPEPQVQDKGSKGLRSGLILSFLGAILVASFYGHDAQWLSLGSQGILAIGLAQLVFYIIQGRHKKEKKRTYPSQSN